MTTKPWDSSKYITPENKDRIEEHKDQMRSEIKPHRVAVVIFTEVEAVDEGDAVFIAERAVKEAIRIASIGNEPLTSITAPRLEFTSRGNNFTVGVHSVKEIGCAARMGLLWLNPTSSAYKKHEN